ncbi:hypothetical protein Fbal_1076 [Ferrimonas balearica DSM 9799]|uniref:Glycosyl transferase family 2 n=1 Tax=Ferrimonas balearica (strain DSM 9799 / CCM 4581 / KCTC 23876 / PAT) TaxID=550540 RepID=E1SUU4_FERBD|nr:hypothetical protein [Ferrimonas balearica]ADN75285.1 hypothetical protein Fbal_1076 [Ferrimonas balearica DSM 9799]
MINKAICVVLYNINASQSNTITSLIKNASGLKEYQVFIYTNGNCLIDVSFSSDISVTIKNNFNNLYLAENYRDALSKCVDLSLDWIVFLDHDTSLTSQFFESLNNQILENNGEVAIYPKIYCKGQQFSPKELRFGFPFKNIDAGEHYLKDYVAINSGSAYRVDFLHNSEAIDSRFPLDYLDYVICSHVTRSSNYKVSVLNTIIDHDLSVSHNERISEFRANSILNSEREFFTHFRSRFEILLYKLALVKRLMRSIFDNNYLYSSSDIIKYILK